MTKAPEHFNTMRDLVEWAEEHSDLWQSTLDSLRSLKGLEVEEALRQLGPNEVVDMLSCGFDGWLEKFSVEDLDNTDIRRILYFAPHLRDVMDVSGFRPEDWEDLAVETGLYRELSAEGRIPLVPETFGSMKELTKYLRGSPFFTVMWLERFVNRYGSISIRELREKISPDDMLSLLDGGLLSSNLIPYHT